MQSMKYDIHGSTEQLWNKILTIFDVE